MSIALTLSGLSSGYGGLRVVNDVFLRLGSTELLGLSGPNGAGKTTLLRTISGQLPAQAGTVRLGERDVTKLPSYERARAGIALVPEGRQIFGGLSVRDNLEITLASPSTRADLRMFRRDIDEVYALFPRLAERREQQGGQLSGGEQQMLAIGRALLLRPSVLLLDEPTQGLAPVVVHQLAGVLKGLRGRFAILLIEQNIAFLREIADTVLMMQGGKLSPEAAKSAYSGQYKETDLGRTA